MADEPDYGTRPGRFWLRELLGVFLLFWILLLLLSLVSFSVEDPSLNHAVTKREIANMGGIIGAYVSGILNDLCGAGSLILPLVLVAQAVLLLTRRPDLRWWRWAGAGLFCVAVLVFFAAADIRIGDLRGGGMLGAAIWSASKSMLSLFGSMLFWIFVFAAGLQLFADFSWKGVIERLSDRFAGQAEEAPQAAASGSEGPSARKLSFEETGDQGGASSEEEGVLDKIFRPFARAASAARGLSGRLGRLRPRREKSAPEDNAPENAASETDEQAPKPRAEKTRGSRCRSVNLAEGSVPFASAEDAGLPMDHSFADEYAVREVVPDLVEGADGEEAEDVVQPAGSSRRRRRRQVSWVTRGGKGGSLLSLLDEGSAAQDEGKAPEAEEAADSAALVFGDEPAAASDEEEEGQDNGLSSGFEINLDPLPQEEEEEDAEDEESGIGGLENLTLEPQAPELPESIDTAVEEAKVAPAPEEPEAADEAEASQPAPARSSRPAPRRRRPAARTAAPQPVPASLGGPVRQPEDGFVLPPLALLRGPEEVDEEEEDEEERSAALMSCLADFGIQAELVRATSGPVVTTYMLRPAPGVSVKVFTRHTDDIARMLMAVSVFIQAPVPGTDTVGIVIPNRVRAVVNFREIASSKAFQQAAGALPVIVGKDTTGRPFVSDLARMPHLLVAGATGQGKSVCLNALLTSLLLTRSPSELKLLLVDPKRVEMGMYEDEPHLVHPVVKEISDASSALQWAVREMDLRYSQMARLYTKNIAGYNARLAGYKGSLPPELADLEPMPYIVIVIDELADLMLQARKDVEPCIIRLAQLARACGIHMIIATQRPSVDVVTGLIKANFPCRICFRVSSRQDSLTTLGNVGAEKLLGNGDMFFNPNGGHFTRLHGPFLHDEEVQSVVDFWKKQAKPEYKVDFSTWNGDEEEGSSEPRMPESRDAMYEEVLEFIREKGHVSISLLQRRFNIGYNKAARYMDQLDADGLVGPSPGAGKPRPVLTR